MSITSRKAALAELRAWATPGTRARLIAAAWLAGEHGIVVLAEAGGVSRQTVYTDLAEHGIDPKTGRAQEGSMYQTIIIEGFTGAEAEGQTDPRLFMTGLHDDLRARGFDPDADIGAFSREVMRVIGAYNVARYHNELIPYAEAEASARAGAERALHRVETCWAALRTARAWEAAHHTWIEAVHEARAAIAAWQTSADETRDHGNRLGTTVGTGQYDLFVPAGQQLAIDPDAPRLALMALEDSTAYRRHITAETLTALRGTGEPSEVGPPPAEEPPLDQG